MNSFEFISALEKDEHSHLGRLLILINVFARQDGKKEIQGLTKLAKLDFLLRYPVYLERALIAENQNPKKARVQSFERDSVESKMVRFKYGPWDFKYRNYLNTLIAKGLAYIRVEGRTINIGITDLGRERAQQILLDESNEVTNLRARVIRQHFNKSATNLMRFIYKTFPEIGNMKYGKEI